MRLRDQPRGTQPRAEAGWDLAGEQTGSGSLSALGKDAPHTHHRSSGQLGAVWRRGGEGGKGRGISSLRDSLIPPGYLQPRHSSLRSWGEEGPALPLLRPPLGARLTLASPAQRRPSLGQEREWGRMFPTPRAPAAPPQTPRREAEGALETEGALLPR